MAHTSLFKIPIDPTGKVLSNKNVERVALLGEDGVELLTKINTPDSAILSSLAVSGHSLAAGGLARVLEEGGYAPKLADQLGVQDLFWPAIGGAIACWSTAGATGDGGWAHTMQKVIRVASNGAGLPEKGAPYNPKAQGVLIHYDLNDLAVLGSSHLRPYKEAMKAIIHRYAAAAVFEDADLDAGGALGGHAFTGTWLTQTTIAQNSGVGFKYTVTAGDKVQFKTPVDLPAGRCISSQLIVGTSDDYVLGVKIDGVAQPDIHVVGSDACDPVATTKTNALIVDWLNQPAGAHTYELTLKTFTAGALRFDCSNILSNPVDGPYFIIPKTNRPITYTLWNTWTHGPASGQPDAMSDVSIPAIETAKDQLIASLPPFHIVRPDLDAALAKDPQWFGADGAHWHDNGNAVVASAILDAIRSDPPTIRQRIRPTRRRIPYWRNVGEQGAAPFQNSWVNQGAALTRFMRDRDGMVRVYVQVKNGSPVSAIVFTLPGGYRPGQQEVLVGANGASAFVLGIVNPTGEVYALFGGNATNTIMAGTFKAEN